ncbi:hypothetical protein [Luethyella okanaganae]|uniref:DUF7847 domain-containing protein n=1 Tax=Luethyella okanaganae TaxID=69372 RepID=A0ABW1VDB5_9MICO
MTDEQNWQPPAAAPQDRPRYGEYAPTPVEPPSRQYGYPQPAMGRQPYGQAPYEQQPGWTPPPKPGLIPLRPLGFGTLIGTPFQVLRRNPKATFGSALLIQAITLVATLVVLIPVGIGVVGRIESATLGERDAVAAGGIAALVLSALVPLAISILASALLQGVIVLEVARATLGEKLTLGMLWKAVFKRLWPLTLWILILAGALLVALGVLVAIITGLVLLGGAFIGVGVLAGVVGGLGLALLFVWLFVKTSLVPCLVVVERAGVSAAIRRSWALTNGYFWKTFGVQLLVGLIVNVVSQVVTTPIMLLYSFAVTLIDPNNVLNSIGPAIGLYLVLIIVTLVVGSIAAVAQAATVALIYIDLRMRKEGLDLELQRFVEAREAGNDDVANPYLVAAGTPHATAPKPASPWA